MKCHRSYLIADFENFSPGTLKMADMQIKHIHSTLYTLKVMYGYLKLPMHPHRKVGEQYSFHSIFSISILFPCNCILRIDGQKCYRQLEIPESYRHSFSEKTVKLCLSC